MDNDDDLQLLDALESDLKNQKEQINDKMKRCELLNMKIDEVLRIIQERRSSK